MKARIYRDVAGEFRWTLRADNGEPIADSAEGYRNRFDAEHGLHLVLAADPLDTEVVVDP